MKKSVKDTVREAILPTVTETVDILSVMLLTIEILRSNTYF